jgi:hypothetical protein
MKNQKTNHVQACINFQRNKQKVKVLDGDGYHQMRLKLPLWTKYFLSRLIPEKSMKKKKDFICKFVTMIYLETALFEMHQHDDEKSITVANGFSGIYGHFKYYAIEAVSSRARKPKQ